MIVAYPKEKRQRVEYDPASYDPLGQQNTPGTVQLIQPALPQQPTAPVQPTQVQQPAPQTAQPQWNVQTAPGVNAPMPQPQTPGSLNVVGDQGQQIAHPSPNAPGGPPSGLAESIALQNQLAEQRRLAAQPPQQPTTGAPTSGLLSDVEPDVARAAGSDPVIQAIQRRVSYYQNMIDNRGGKSTPQIDAKIADLQRQADERVAKIRQSVLNARYEANNKKKAEDEKARKASEAQASQAAEKKRVAEVRKLAAISASKAEEALGARDYAQAVSIAQQALREHRADLTESDESRLLRTIDKARAAVKQRYDNEIAGQREKAKAKELEISLIEKKLTKAKNAADNLKATDTEGAQKLDAKIAEYEQQIIDKTQELLSLQNSIAEKVSSGPPAIETPQPQPEQPQQQQPQQVVTPQLAPQGPVRVQSQAEVDKLPSGTIFVGPDGRRWRKN